MDDQAEKWARTRQANKVLAILSVRGARFFYSEPQDRTARFGLDRFGQVWYVDAKTGMMVYPFGTGHWQGFTHDAFLRDLVTRLAVYIENGKKLSVAWFHLDAFNSAYAESADEVRTMVLETSVVKEDK